MVDEKKTAAAFTEWARRFRDEPERFASEWLTAMKADPITYGDSCAPYFLQILAEVS